MCAPTPSSDFEDFKERVGAWEVWLCFAGALVGMTITAVVIGVSIAIAGGCDTNDSFDIFKPPDATFESLIRCVASVKGEIAPTPLTLAWIYDNPAAMQCLMAALSNTESPEFSE